MCRNDFIYYLSIVNIYLKSICFESFSDLYLLMYLYDSYCIFYKWHLEDKNKHDMESC